MEDNDFEFETEVKKPWTTVGGSRRRHKSEPRYYNLTRKVHSDYDSTGRPMGLGLIALEDGGYIFDEDCHKLIAVEDFEEHCLNEHFLLGRTVEMTSEPSKDL